MGNFFRLISANQDKKHYRRNNLQRKRTKTNSYPIRKNFPIPLKFMLSMLIGVIDGRGICFLSTLDKGCTRRFDVVVSVSSCVTTISGTTAVVLCAPIF